MKRLRPSPSPPAARLPHAGWLLLLLALALPFMITACATAGGPRSGGDANTITREQIEESSFTNAYDLVRALRGNWLRKRGTASINNDGDVIVYLDRTRYGGPTSLREINTSDVERITHLSAREASSRYGLDHVYGAVLVETRTGR